MRAPSRRTCGLPSRTENEKTPKTDTQAAIPPRYECREVSRNVGSFRNTCTQGRTGQAERMILHETATPPLVDSATELQQEHFSRNAGPRTLGVTGDKLSDQWRKCSAETPNVSTFCSLRQAG